MTSPSPKTAQFPCSPQQDRLVSLQHEGRLFRARLLIQIRGHVDLDRLKAAVTAVIKQHDILRTAFRRDQDGRAVCFVLQDSHVNLFEHRAEGSLEGIMESLYDQALHHPLHPGRPPLVRIELVATRHMDNYLLLFSLPSLCADEPTLHALTRSLAQNYAQTETSPPDPPAYPLDHPTPPVFRTELYRLAKQLRLPFERTVRFRGPFDPKNLSLPLPSQVLEVVKDRQIPTQKFLLAAWMILIRRLVDRNDIIVGVAVDQKDRAPSQLGPLVKYLPFHAIMDLRLSVSHFLEQVQADYTALEADYPNFTWDRAAPNTGQFLPIAFDCCSLPRQYDAGDVHFEIVRRESQVDRFKLKLTCLTNVTTPTCTLLYDPRYFSAGEMFRLGGRFQCLLNRLLDSPQTPLGNISLLSDSERRGLLQSLNETARPYPLDRCIHHLFEGAAHRNPSRIAVRCGYFSLTFAELETRANRLAHVLTARGAGPETTVAVCLSRSPELVIALLAVLKTGAAFLPLDPQAPRGELTAGFSRASLAVCGGDQHPDDISAQAVIHPDDNNLSSAPGTPPAVSVCSQNTALVLPTSTVQGPAAVSTSHRVLVNYVYWCRELWPETGKTGAFVFSSSSSTHTITSLFVSLTAGLPVEILHQEAGIEDLARFMRREHHTGMLKLAPEQLDLLTQLMSPEDLEKGSWTILLDGEIHPSGSLERFRAFSPHALFVQEYSRDEAGFGSCAFRVRPNDKPRIGIPIGRPTPNNRVYLLNEQLEPVPVDVPGSIFLGGEGLSRGYLQEPALTAQYFVPDPLSQIPGSRLFRTDDTACFQPNGQLRFIGRQDRRAVIDGYRVRMEEIESVIRAQPHVRDVAVGRNHDLDSLGGLVAWLAPEPDLDLIALRTGLTKVLPPHTLPIDLILVDDLPHSPTADSGAAYLLANDGGQQSWLGPRTPVEYWLSQLWKEILGISWAGSSTHFFENGGDSLLVSRLISGIRRLFQVDLPVQVIFDAPTIAALAGQINIHRKLGSHGQINNIPAVPRERGLPLSFPQAMLCTLAGGEFREVTGNQPAILRVDGLLETDTLERAVIDLLERHETPRTTFFNTGSQPIQVIGFADSWKLDYLDYSHLSPRDQSREISWLTSMEPVRNFDIEKDLLFRMTVVKQAESHFLMIVTTHQMVCDEASMNILLSELGVLYNARLLGNPYPLQPLTLQYGDFAVWQRRRLSGKLFRDQLNWWHRHLLGVPALRLAPDNLKGTARGSTFRFRLPATYPELLRSMNGKHSVTSFMTMLAAFKLLIRHHTGANDFCVGSPVSLRNRAELASIVGNFSNMLAIRTEINENSTFLQLLNQVKTGVLGAWTHRDIPVSYLNRRLGFHSSRPPLFKVLFEVGNLNQPPLQFHNLDVNRLPIEVWSGAFDLKLSLTITQDGIRGTFSYNTLIFTQAVLANWADMFDLILETAFKDQQIPIDQLVEIARDAEKDRRKGRLKSTPEQDKNQ